MAIYHLDHTSGNDSTGDGSLALPWKTIGKAMSIVAAGDKVWVKASCAYTEQDGTTGTIGTIITAGNQANPIVFEGYTTTTGDGGQATLLGDKGGAATINFCIASNIDVSNFYAFKNLIFKNAVSHGVRGGTAAVGGDNFTFWNCIAEDNGGKGFWCDNNCHFDGCTARNNGSIGIHSDVSSTVFGCVVHGNTGTGILLEAGVVEKCLVHHNAAASGTTYQIEITAGSANHLVFVDSCTIDGAKGETATTIVGIRFSSSAVNSQRISNCIIHDCDTGISAVGSAGDTRVSRKNIFSSCTTTGANWTLGADDLVDPAGAPGFVDEATENYRLTAASPAKAAGYDFGAIVP